MHVLPDASELYIIMSFKSLVIYMCTYDDTCNMMNYSLQNSYYIFYPADTQDAPRTLFLDSSSSMESLCSSGSATSTSNFSKGSSPPGSPTGSRKKSFFNPAEVDKLPSAAKVKHTQVAHVVTVWYSGHNSKDSLYLRQL